MRLLYIVAFDTVRRWHKLQIGRTQMFAQSVSAAFLRCFMLKLYTYGLIHRGSAARHS